MRSVKNAKKIGNQLQLVTYGPGGFFYGHFWGTAMGLFLIVIFHNNLT